MREKAVALRYQDPGELPKIIANGAGEVANQIIRIAQENGIPIQENEQLAEMLSGLSIGAEITPETYRLVAEIMCFLYYTDAQWAEDHHFLTPILEVR